MARIILSKLLYVCLSLFAVITLTFVLMKAIPGDPFQQEQALPKEIYESLRSHYGLNDPISTQYVRYIKQLFAFNFGPSLIYKDQSVTGIIKGSFPISALLGLTALAFAIPAGLMMGIIGAQTQNRWQDRCLSMLSMIGISVPSFVIATILQYLLGIKLGVLPIARWGSFAHLIMPATALAAMPVAFIAKMVRTQMINEMKLGYITTARAKGLSEARIIRTHALHNILIPVISYLGPLVAGILTGSFIVEKIFGIPGLGYWFVTSVFNRDYPMIMGITVFYCAFLLLTTFLVDLINLYLDPRLKHGKP